MPELSIIIPVYNAENYIERCLDSVINQTIKDIEIIITDDHSNDNTLKILEKYAKHDNRIVLIKNEENLGIGKTRNKALKVACGEYIGFVDNDDWVDLNYFETLISEIKKENADVCYSASIKIHKENLIHPHTIIQKDRRHAIFIERTPPWTKVYKREFLIKNNILFTETRGEDILPAFMTAYYADKIAEVKNVFYNCYIRDNSFSHKEAQEFDLTEISIYKEIFKLIENSQNKKYWLRLIKKRGLITFDSLYKKAKKELRKRIIEDYKKVFNQNPIYIYLFWKIQYKIEKLISYFLCKIFFL